MMIYKETLTFLKNLKTHNDRVWFQDNKDKYNNAQKNFSSSVGEEIDKEVRKIIDFAHEQAREIIIKRKEDVTLVAETLLINETINEEEIDYLIEHRKMPDETVTQKDAAHFLDSTKGSAPSEEPVKDNKDDIDKNSLVDNKDSK